MKNYTNRFPLVLSYKDIQSVWILVDVCLDKKKIPQIFFYAYYKKIAPVMQDGVKVFRGVGFFKVDSFPVYRSQFA